MVSVQRRYDKEIAEAFIFCIAVGKKVFCFLFIPFILFFWSTHRIYYTRIAQVLLALTVETIEKRQRKLTRSECSWVGKNERILRPAYPGNIKRGTQDVDNRVISPILFVRNLTIASVFHFFFSLYFPLQLFPLFELDIFIPFSNSVQFSIKLFEKIAMFNWKKVYLVFFLWYVKSYRYYIIIIS